MPEICCWITPACTYQSGLMSFGLMSFDLEVEGIIKLNVKVERIIKMIALKPGQLLAFIQSFNESCLYSFLGLCLKLFRRGYDLFFLLTGLLDL